MNKIEKGWQEQVEKDIDGLSSADLLDYIIERSVNWDGSEDCFDKFASDFAAQRLKNTIASMESRLDDIDNDDTSDGLAMWRCGC